MDDRILSPRRTGLYVAIGVAVGVGVGLAGAPMLAPLAAWCTAGLIALVHVWRACWPQDAVGTERLANEESSSRLTDDALVVACLASVGAMLLALVQARDASDPVSVATVVLGILATMVAWALVNTAYALKYARIYYVDHDRDGFDVKQEAPPTYSDFAYLAFTIGMSYSAPDVEPDDTRTRRTALPHALLSYFFGTVLIATTLNLVTNLAQT
ncbi:DUF1345 domain-containing protein [Frondihabitans sp. VKM Ac-2883]|uniref:DUF1345 domain-containing protein n=1 Tax=Frondihabitans sp. VKM Ac-2883 TaxID=2783823 RepID=UPI00188B1B1E|nr:DUF1345 domain-containing protein [Frondihabitans sp. VKM Ac-2883]MBF4575494.1 DUF1345 domain-containing protein [Frondihabitans sp. VKM Ac-2883]